VLRLESSAFRILFTPKALGYVEQSNRNGDYRLGLKVLPLARGVSDRATLVSIARPLLEKLCNELGESVWLAQLRVNEIMMVDALLAPYRLQLSLEVGDLCPIHASSLGKVVAAHLEPRRLDEALDALPLQPYTSNTITDVEALRTELFQVREQGYAVNDEETVNGAIVIGAPVFDADGRVCESVSVSALADRSDDAHRQVMIEGIKTLGAAIGEHIESMAVVVGKPPKNRHKTY